MTSKKDCDVAQIELDALYNETISDPFLGVPKTAGDMTKIAADMLPHLHQKILLGWQLLLSCNIIDDNGTERKIYNFSAVLYPVGRGSKEEDWKLLGWSIGYLENKINKDNKTDNIKHIPITNIETADPNGVFHWVWIFPKKE